MSILNHSKFVPNRGRRSRRAFTLIELLVVVAIIALLISILLPALSQAKESARATVCGAQMRGIANAMNIYFSEQDEWIPGMNTSGVALRALRLSGTDPMQRPNIPVQMHDWLTPLMRYDSDDLGDTRAKRFQLVVNRYACPSQRGIKSVLYGNPRDRPQFDELTEDWTTLSYLMPVHFQYWGQNDAGRPLAPYAGMSAGNVLALAANPAWEVLVDNYLSKLNRVGLNLAKKIAFADGTRYLTDTLILDHDITHDAFLFGSFTSSGAWWSGSTAYGVRSGSTNCDGKTVGRGSRSNGANLSLSYRHRHRRGSGIPGDAHSNGGAINAMFFDGHVAIMGDCESRNIEFWYPRGGMVQSLSDGMTDWDTSVPIQ